VHETARVSTPETDVPVPLPAQDKVTVAAGIPQDRNAEPTEWWQTPAGKALGLAVVAVAVLVVLANLDAGVAIMLLAIGGLVAFALYSRRGGQTVDAAGRRVLRAGYAEQISEAERSRELEEEISQYMGRGFFVRQRTATTAQLMRPKRFSFLWALLWFLVFGVGIVVYLIYYAAKQDQGRYLEVDEYGAVKATRQIRHVL
jgi:multisubunit Na+/H+ antiporter MnhB subunit